MLTYTRLFVGIFAVGLTMAGCIDNQESLPSRADEVREAFRTDWPDGETNLTSPDPDQMFAEFKLRVGASTLSSEQRASILSALEELSSAYGEGQQPFNNAYNQASLRLHSLMSEPDVFMGIYWPDLPEKLDYLSGRVALANIGDDYKRNISIAIEGLRDAGSPYSRDDVQSVVALQRLLLDPAVHQELQDNGNGVGSWGDLCTVIMWLCIDSCPLLDPTCVATCTIAGWICLLMCD